MSRFRGGELFQMECGLTKVTFSFSSLHSQSHPCLFLCQGCPGAYLDKAQHPQKGAKFWGQTCPAASKLEKCPSDNPRGLEEPCPLTDGTSLPDGLPLITKYSSVTK